LQRVRTGRDLSVPFASEMGHGNNQFACPLIYS